MRRIFAGLFLLLCWQVVLAQTPPVFSGNWKVTWQGEKRELEGSLLISENGGVWKTFASNKINPCVGREVPIEVKKVNDREIRVLLKYSDVIQGCENGSLRLWDENGSVKGARGKDGKIGLVLQRIR